MNKIDKLFKLHEEYDFHNKKLNRGLEKRNQGLLFLFFSAFILTLTIFSTMTSDISSDAEKWSKINVNEQHFRFSGEIDKEVSMNNPFITLRITDLSDVKTQYARDSINTIDDHASSIIELQLVAFFVFIIAISFAFEKNACLSKEKAYCNHFLLVFLYIVFASIMMLMPLFMEYVFSLSDMRPLNLVVGLPIPFFLKTTLFLFIVHCLYSKFQNKNIIDMLKTSSIELLKQNVYERKDDIEKLEHSFFKDRQQLHELNDCYMRTLNEKETKIINDLFENFDKFTEQNNSKQANFERNLKNIDKKNDSIK